MVLAALVSRRALCYAATLAACSLPSSSVADSGPLDEAAKQAIRDAALRPNKYGTFGDVPEASPPSPAVINWRGQLAPEDENDTRVRYSNPYAARLAEVSERAKAEWRAPDAPKLPIRRDGVLSVKPANLLCDANGRNCKFAGPTTTSTPGPRGPDEVPDGKFLRDDLDFLKGNF